MVLFYILIATFLVSLVSFIGVLVLFLREELLDKILLALVAFSAGALVGGAFLHLMPEALAHAEGDAILKIFLFLILGFCAFFILEHFIMWHHHHAGDCQNCARAKPFSYLILVSDSIHNFIDGLVIAASFAVSLPVGLVTTLMVALHEIPQEVGDFGVLIYGGFKKIKALFLNFLSGIFAVLGGIGGFLLAEKIGKGIIFLLPFAAGNFLYIAASDLIPEIKQKTAVRKSIVHFFFFLLGIVLMLLMRVL